MTFLPANSKAAFLPTYDVFSEDDSQRLYQLNKNYTDTANAVNVRDISLYDTVELLNGQQFFTTGNAQKKRYGYRKVFSIGTVNAGATLTTAHGLTGVTLFTRIYGTVITATPDYRPIPYTSTTAVNQQIEIRVDGTNFYVVNGGAAPQISSGIVVLEYLKN